MFDLHRRFEKKSDISKLGRFTLDRVRSSDEGVYSCESTGFTMLGYDKTNQKRWFRLNVGPYVYIYICMCVCKYAILCMNFTV